MLLRRIRFLNSLHLVSPEIVAYDLNQPRGPLSEEQLCALCDTQFTEKLTRQTTIMRLSYSPVVRQVLQRILERRIARKVKFGNFKTCATPNSSQSLPFFRGALLFTDYLKSRFRFGEW